MSSRRSFIGGAAAALALSAPVARALSGPRLRVIIDNDFSADPDGLFQLAHHLASPSVDIPFIVGAHTHVGDFLDGSLTQADNAAVRVKDIYARIKGGRTPPVVAGRNRAPDKGAAPEMTASARMIIAEAMRDDSRLPLVYAAGAGLTDLAEALRLEPRIGKRLKLIWIGGAEYADLLPGVPERRGVEYNLATDVAAAQTVFNASDVEIWQVPRNVYRQMMISDAELKAGLRPAGALGDYLWAQIERVKASPRLNLGETYILGDSPLVTLTALQSSFDADSSSSAYVVRPTPQLTDDGHYTPASNGRPMRVYTAIDARLTFADMFAKFAAMAA